MPLHIVEVRTSSEKSNDSKHLFASSLQQVREQATPKNSNLSGDAL